MWIFSVHIIYSYEFNNVSNRCFGSCNNSEKTSVVVKKCKVCINVNFKKYAYYNKLDVSYFPLLYIFIAENKIEI